MDTKLGQLFAALVVAVTCGSARAQSVNATTTWKNAPMTFEQRRHNHHFDEDDAAHQAAMDPDPLGRTRLKILAPEGAIAHLYRGEQEVYADDVPTVSDVAPREHYRLVIAFTNGAVWEHPIEVRPGNVLRLWIAPNVPPGYPPPGNGPVVATTTSSAPPQMGPQPIDANRLNALKGAIINESFPEQQMSVLRTAAAHDFFTVAQVGQLVDLFSFPRDKVEAVRLCRAHTVDPENGYTLSSHFDFPSDKSTVQKMFQ